MGEDIVFPAAGFISIGIEAVYQTTQAANFIEKSEFEDKYQYRLRNITFSKALVLSDDPTVQQIMTTLMPTQEPWYEFRISSLTEETWTEHSRGLISLQENSKQGTLSNSVILRTNQTSCPRICSHASPTQSLWKLMV